jgi:putative ABC transport system permease protein
MPYSSGSSSRLFEIQGRSTPAGAPPLTAERESISPDYFAAMHIPLRAGRLFTDGDGADAPQVVIVSESIARNYFPGRTALGERIRFRGRADNPWQTIVGVATNVRHDPVATLTDAIYCPFRQDPQRAFDIILRTHGDPRALIPAISAKLRDLDRRQTVVVTRTLVDVYEQQVAGLRFVASLMGSFGFLALALAAIGVYGVMANSVAERRHEIGVRMALGANRQSVLRQVVGRGLRLSLAGLALGLVGALGLARLLSDLIWGVSAFDPATFIGGGVVLAGAAVLASYFPARRASLIDPAITLRTE